MSNPIEIMPEEFEKAEAHANEILSRSVNMEGEQALAKCFLWACTELEERWATMEDQLKVLCDLKDAQKEEE